MRILEDLRPSLPADGTEHVEDLLAVGELEMAGESLGPRVVQNHLRLRAGEQVGFLEVGKALGLDRESAYDPDFWRNFVAWLHPEHVAFPSPPP